MLAQQSYDWIDGQPAFTQDQYQWADGMPFIFLDPRIPPSYEFPEKSLAYLELDQMFESKTEEDQKLTGRTEKNYNFRGKIP